MNDDWVARLLAETERPEMPEDVAERLELGLRRHLADTGAGTTTAGTTAPDAEPVATVHPTPDEVTVGGVTPDRPGPDETPTDPPSVDDVTAPAGASAVTTAGPSTGPPAAVPAPSSDERDDEPARGAVPAPAVVPPAAGAGAGAAPLRAGADGHDDARADDDGPDGAAVSRTREGRTFGTPRREQRADDQGERRRRLLTRWVPVAAGVLVLGAAGAVTVNFLGGSSDSTAETAEEVAAADVADSVAPRSLVATGTEYTTADVETFQQQVRDLVALAAAGTEDASAATPESLSAEAGAAAAEPSAPAPASAAQADPAAARASAADNPLADADALRECVETVTDGTDEDAAAVDLALVNGVESTVVVVPDPAGANLFVYVVGPDCTGVDSQFQFFTVAP